MGWRFGKVYVNSSFGRLHQRVDGLQYFPAGFPAKINFLYVGAECCASLSKHPRNYPWFALTGLTG